MIVIGESRIEVQLTPASTDKPAPPDNKPLPSLCEPALSEAAGIVVKTEAAPSPLSDMSPRDSPLVMGSGGSGSPQAGIPGIESVATERDGHLSNSPIAPADDNAKCVVYTVTQDTVGNGEAVIPPESIPNRSLSKSRFVLGGAACPQDVFSDGEPPSRGGKFFRHAIYVVRKILLRQSERVNDNAFHLDKENLPPSMTQRWLRSWTTSKWKIILATTCGLALLLGVGFGLRFALHSKPGKTASPTKQVASKPKPKPAPTWNDSVKTFKPEGDKDQQAKQRIAFLKKLIRRFPNDQPNILAAYLDIARQYKQLKEPKRAIGYFEEFLGKAGRDDKRRSGCMASLIRALLAGGRTGEAMSVFDGFFEEKPAAASAEAERICATARAGGRPEQTAELATAFEMRLLQHSGKNANQGEQELILALSRDERWARTELWMGEVKERIPWDNNDEQTMLIGILGGMRSVDCFVKAMLTNKRLTGEGCDVSGRFEDHSYIIACQYPCKADQLLSWYGKTGFEEYRTAAVGFIRKMHKLYTSTRDGSGRNWLPIGQFVGTDGKACDYGNAPKLERNVGRNDI